LREQFGDDTSGASPASFRGRRYRLHMASTMDSGSFRPSSLLSSYGSYNGASRDHGEGGTAAAGGGGSKVDTATLGVLAGTPL